MKKGRTFQVEKMPCVMNSQEAVECVQEVRGALGKWNKPAE